MVALLAGALVLTAVACGGGKDDAKATTDPTNTATQTATDTPTKSPPTPTPTATPFAGDVARIKIPRFGVDAPIELLGVDSTNTLETPQDENNAVGWYNIYDRPGWHGNAVFSAHVYYHNLPAPFVNLSKANPGDQVVITMIDGTEYTYEVFANDRYHRDTIPMGDIIWPQNRPAGEEWVTLITCGGELDASGWEYISRDVIVAKRVS
jgi:sortase (surface protein transpeptidase)